jgi:hypothetical protein
MMDYEEKLIDGHTHFRAKPDGEWLRKYATSETITLSITEYEQLKKQADRYEWLRNKAIYCDTLPTAWCVFGDSATNCHPCDGEELDKAINEAMEEEMA